MYVEILYSSNLHLFLNTSYIYMQVYNTKMQIHYDVIWQSSKIKDVIILFLHGKLTCIIQQVDRDLLFEQVYVFYLYRQHCMWGVPIREKKYIYLYHMFSIKPCLYQLADLRRCTLVCFSAVIGIKSYHYLNYRNSETNTSLTYRPTTFHILLLYRIVIGL